MNLPLTLQMEIDISAAAHKQDIAESFARLRERLLPPETMEDTQHALNLMYQRLLANTPLADRQPYFNSPYGNNALWPPNWFGVSNAASWPY